jgi:hypothetical protein
MSIRYRVLGTTDDVTACDICGREDLKSTVVLSGADGELYAGSDCASKLTGLRVSEVNLQKRAADRAARETEHATRRAIADAKFQIQFAEFREWMIQTHGVYIDSMGDLMDQAHRLGRTPFSYRQQWKSARSAA